MCLECVERLERQSLSLGERWEEFVVGFVIVCIGGFAIDTHSPIESEHLTFCYEGMFQAISHDGGDGFVDFGVSHLRCDRTLSDETVEFLLLVVVACARIGKIRRSDTFVRFLCSFFLGFVVGGIAIVVTELFGDVAFDRFFGSGRHVDRVGSHVGDMSSFVEFLGDLHSLRDGESEFATGFLLESRCGKRCSRTLGSWFGSDGFDGI